MKEKNEGAVIEGPSVYLETHTGETALVAKIQGPLSLGPCIEVHHVSIGYVVPGDLDYLRRYLPGEAFTSPAEGQMCAKVVCRAKTEIGTVPAVLLSGDSLRNPVVFVCYPDLAEPGTGPVSYLFEYDPGKGRLRPYLPYGIRSLRDLADVVLQPLRYEGYGSRIFARRIAGGLILPSIREGYAQQDIIALITKQEWLDPIDERIGKAEEGFKEAQERLRLKRERAALRQGCKHLLDLGGLLVRDRVIGTGASGPDKPLLVAVSNY